MARNTKLIQKFLSKASKTSTKATKTLTGKKLIADFKNWSGGFTPEECMTEQLKEYASGDKETLSALTEYAAKHTDTKAIETIKQNMIKAGFDPIKGSETKDTIKMLEMVGTPAKTTKQTNKVAIQNTNGGLMYTGAPIEATRVFHRPMPEFKNCIGECWLILNEEAKTYTTCNTYNGNLKASYNPKHYTYSLTEKAQKKIDKKLQEQGFLQVEEVADFPTFCTFAKPTMDLLPKNLQKKIIKLRKSIKAK